MSEGRIRENVSIHQTQPFFVNKDFGSSLDLCALLDFAKELTIFPDANIFNFYHGR